MANTKIPSELIADNSVGIDALNVSDGTNGQVLTTDGSGTLSFSTISSGATDINGLSDAKTFGTSSIMIGDTDTGTINAANYNTGLGVGVFNSLTEGDENVMVGFAAGQTLTTGSHNIGIGTNAVDDCSTGSYNVGIGTAALGGNTTGGENTTVGTYALQANTTGSTNTVIGFRAGYGRTSGGENVIIGSDASYSVGTGGKNVAIGVNAGYNWTTAYNNTVIGYNARTDEYNSYGAITIGYNGTGYSSESVTFVNGSSKTYVGIGSTNWGGTSDQRLKENIQASTAGLSFINDLRPVTFDWKKKKDIDNSLEGYENSDDRYNSYNPINRHGFVAQEVKTALDNHSEVLSGSEIWSESKDGTQGISEIALIPMLVKALQEVDDKIDALTTRIETLESE